MRSGGTKWLSRPIPGVEKDGVMWVRWDDVDRKIREYKGVIDRVIEERDELGRKERMWWRKYIWNVLWGTRDG